MITSLVMTAAVMAATLQQAPAPPMVAMPAAPEAVAAVPALPGAAGGAARDTVIPVEPGTRLIARNHQGSIHVRTWDRREVRLSPGPSEVPTLSVRRSEKLLRIHAGPGPGAPREVRMELTVPADMALDLAGPSADVTVETSRGQVTIETVNGTTVVRGGRGSVSIRSVNGGVLVEGSRGSVQVHSVVGRVRVADVEGEVWVEAINGNVDLRAIRSGSVRASTVEGSVRYDGEIRDEGRYRLITHSGAVTVVVPEDVNATVAVKTFAGDFRASFPVTLQTGPGKQFEFALGTGSARLELEAFAGRIQLVRPGERVDSERR